MVLAAIDPGTIAGWAVRLADKSVLFGTWNLGALDRRLVALRGNLDIIHTVYAISTLAFEEPWIGPWVHPAASLYQMRGVITEWSAEAGIACVGYSPKEIKASIAGGRATKQRMMETVRWM